MWEIHVNGCQFAASVAAKAHETAARERPDRTCGFRRT